MKPLIVCLAAGVCMTAAGVGLLWAATRGTAPLGVVFVGLALLLLGPVVFAAGFVVDMLRRPTPQELARQKADDDRTWHIRPLGLLILVAGVGVCLVGGAWAGQYV